MLRRLAEEPRRHPAGEQVAPRLLGIQQLLVDRRRRVEMSIFILNHIDLPPRALEIAGEGQQFEEEQPLRMVGGMFLDVQELGRDGVLQPSGLVVLSGCHLWAS